MSTWIDTIFLRSFRIRPAGWWRAVVLCLLTWQARAEQRYRLADLDDAILKDIGVDRADVERECRKPFWRA